MNKDLNLKNAYADIPVVILSGGKPILSEFSLAGRQNKALVEVNGKPLLWWNLLHYAKYGARRFLVPVGTQNEQFPDLLLGAFGAEALSESREAVDGFHDANGVKGVNGIYKCKIAGFTCEIRLITTPASANTAQRLLACAPWLGACSTFCVTYSDTLSDVDLIEELVFHRATGLTATVVAAQMPSRFRVMGIRHSDYLVRAFAAKPVIQSVPINGGYYIFESELLSKNYLESGIAPLEQTPLERLAAELQLGAFNHRGTWQHLDSERDLERLREVALLIEKMPAMSA